MDELQRAMRVHGISTYHAVALAVFEVDGSISFLLQKRQGPVTKLREFE
jgi:uncharacterized membrane protein YcaP (DUF421 family)